jgi:hydrogenase maturation protease
MSLPTLRPVVLGVGNILLRDEGVGVAVVRHLVAAAALAEDTAGSPLANAMLVDGGTLGLDLLDVIRCTDRLIMIDAVDIGGAPGTVVVLRGPDVQGTLNGHVSPHQVGVGDLIAVASLTGTLPRDVVLIGIQPGAIEIGLDLTPAVAAAVQVAADLVLDELALAVA